MRPLTISAIALAVLAQGGCAWMSGRVAEPEVLTEFVKSAEHPRNSEGDVVRLTDGRLLIVYSHFYRDKSSPFPEGGCDDSSAELVLTESSDGGRAWSPIRTVVRKPADCLNVMSASFLRLRDGRLALFYLLKRSAVDCRPVMIVSSDEGRTWTKPVLCINDADVSYYVLNNARAIQTEKGRLLLPVAQYPVVDGPEGKRRIGRSSFMACALSDDGGVTWRLSADRKRPSDGHVYLEEPGLVRLRDGRLMMYARSNERCQWCLYSTDDGDHWSEPERITTYATTTNSPVTYVRLSTGELVVVLNDAAEHPADEKVVEYERRWPFGVAVSSDEGRTWRKKLLERDDPKWKSGLHCCYCAAREIDGRLLLVYCHRDALATTRVLSVPLEWLPR